MASPRELRDDFGMSVKEIKEFTKKSDSQLASDLGMTVADVRKALQDTPQKMGKGTRLFEEETDLPIARYAPLEKPKRKLKRAEVPKSLDVPMASVQSILNRLAKADVKAVVTIPVKTAQPKKPEKIGSTSEISEKEMIEAVKAGKEVELSLGRYYQSFKPGVPASGFFRLCEYLNKPKNGFRQDAQESTTIEIDGDIRKISPKNTYERKIREKTYDSPTQEFRISISTETEVPEPKNFRPRLFRERTRSSFVNSAKNLRVDLTEVRQSSGSKTFNSFEVELELLKAKKVMDLSSLVEVATTLMIVVQGVSRPDMLMTRKEFGDFVQQHNSLLARPTVAGYPASKYWNKPTDLELQDLMERGQDYAITSKLDGERRLLVLLENGVYENTRPSIWKIGGGVGPEHAGSILDTEYYEETKTYWVFDVLIYNGKSVKEEPLATRDGYRSLFQNVKLWDGASINPSKKFFYPSPEKGVNIYKCAMDANRWQRKFKDLQFDGFIFQPLGKYDTPFSRKWKPVELTTIDFLLTPTKKKGYYTYSVFDTRSGTNVPFLRRGVEDNIYISPKRAEEIGLYRSCATAEIVAECMYVGENPKRFEVHRLRPDRTTANELFTANSVWKHIVSPVDEAVIFGQDLKLMRRVHNRTKEFLLRNFQGASTIMDVGSGQGGDLDKWSALDFKKVFVVEPDLSGDKLEELNRRYNPNKHSTIEIIRDPEGAPSGLEDTDDILRQTSKSKVEGIAAFFCLTFIGGSKKMIRRAVDTISSVLTVPGQKLVGIVLDGEETNKLLDQVREGSDTRSQYVALSDTSDKFKIFSISETGKESKITDSFTSREIKTEIPGSHLQKPIVEWTFPYEFFRSNMRESGFIETSTGFLTPTRKSVTQFKKATKSIKSRRTKKKEKVVDPALEEEAIPVPQDVEALEQVEEVIASSVDSSYENLPNQAKVFSGLQRYFVFERQGKSPTPKIGIPTDKPVVYDRDIAGVGVSDLSLKILPVPQDNSAIFNAFVALINEKYREPTEELIDAKEEVTRARKTWAKQKGDAASSEALFKAEEKVSKLEKPIKKIPITFRTETLPKFLKANTKKLPKDMVKKYGSAEAIIDAVKDLRKEIPVGDALTLLSLYASLAFEDKEPAGMLLVNPQGKAKAYGCKPRPDAVMMFYQGYDKDLETLGVEERGGLREKYFPMVMADPDEGKTYSVFVAEDETVNKILKKVC